MVVAIKYYLVIIGHLDSSHILFDYGSTKDAGALMTKFDKTRLDEIKLQLQTKRELLLQITKHNSLSNE